MSEWLFLLNGISVSLFGSIISASFCNVLSSSRNTRIFFSCVSVTLVIQGLLYSIFDVQVLRYIYPIMMHLPLIIILFLLTKKLLWSFVSVLCAYMCCQLRRWLSLFVVALASGEDTLQAVVEILITVPLLLVLLKVVSPEIKLLSEKSFNNRYQFVVIPALYYVFDYTTIVYTNLLINNHPVIVEFMPFVCCVSYLVFLMYHSIEDQKKTKLLQTQKILDVQVKQAVREICSLRESQSLAIQYRHDLRHHLQYVLSCIENGKIENAKDYIGVICHELEVQRIKRYCENETANLIFSSFVGRAEKDNIKINIQGDISSTIKVSDNDLCVLLSNALENAIHSCQKITGESLDCTIDVKFYMRNDKLFLQVTNPCGNDVRFENGLPISERSGHGIGVQSICTIVERYGGLYSFSSVDGMFVLRLSI